MSGLKRKEEEIGLVDLDAEKDEGQAGGKKEQEADVRKRQHNGATVRLALICIVAGSLALILLSTMLFQIPLITAGIVTVLEAGIAAALNNTPFPVHIAVMVLRAVIGVFFGKPVLMILAAAYYFLLLVALKLIELDG